jgi:hypothetical protein
MCDWSYYKTISRTDINHSFTCCFVWVWKLVSHVKARRRIERLVTGCCGKCLELRGMKEAIENYAGLIFRSMICALHQILSGSSRQKDDIWGICRVYPGNKKRDTILIEKPDENRALVRTRHKWQDNIKTGLRWNRSKKHGLDYVARHGEKRGLWRT